MLQHGVFALPWKQCTGWDPLRIFFLLGDLPWADSVQAPETHNLLGMEGGGICMWFAIGKGHQCTSRDISRGVEFCCEGTLLLRKGFSRSRAGSEACFTEGIKTAAVKRAEKRIHDLSNSRYYHILHTALETESSEREWWSRKRVTVCHLQPMRKWCWTVMFH